MPQPGVAEATTVVLVGTIAALAVLAALVVRAVQGRRRDHRPRSGYS
ncbi:MAG: hypothetical protein ACRDKA_07860 [Actinomycetota bacterium]